MFLKTPLLVQCGPTVYDAGPTLIQRWLNGSCLLGMVVLSDVMVILYPLICNRQNKKTKVQQADVLFSWPNSGSETRTNDGGRPIRAVVGHAQSRLPPETDVDGACA